ncbi:MAG: cell division protein FtsA [Patescibacteria group bacterium]
MFLTALDIGSSQIKSLVAEIRKDGRLSLLGVLKTPSAGIRKGEMVSFDDAVRSLNQAIHEIKQLNKSAVKNIFINASGENINLQNSRGIVAVSRADNEIYGEDIERAVKASQAVNIGPNRMILHTLTSEFIVDGVRNINDPLGMTGNRLEVNSLIIDAFKPVVNNLIRAVEAAGGKVGGLLYSPLAASRSCLSKAQKELGVVMIDIGFGTTGISVYEENKILQAKVFPVGAGNITNDLAIGLKCPINVAETIKLSFGSALAKDVSSGKEKIDLHEIDKNLKSMISRRFISEIIEIRLAEIFEFVNNELKLIGKMAQLPAGAVIVGGGAKMPGLAELAKQELKLSAQIASPEIGEFELINADFENQLDDPEFAEAVGLLLEGRDQSLKDAQWSIGDKFSKFSTIRKILKHFTP